MKITKEIVLATVGTDTVMLDEAFSACFREAGYYEEIDEHGWYLEFRLGSEEVWGPFPTYANAVHNYHLHYAQQAFVCSNLPMEKFLELGNLLVNYNYLNIYSLMYDLRQQEDALLAERDELWIRLTDEDKSLDERGLPKVFTKRFEIASSGFFSL